MGRQYDASDGKKNQNESKSNRAILAYSISGILGVAFAVFLHLEMKTPDSETKHHSGFETAEHSEDDPDAIFISKDKKEIRSPAAVEEKPAFEREVAADRKLLEEPEWKAENAVIQENKKSPLRTCAIEDMPSSADTKTLAEVDWKLVVEAFDKSKRLVQSWVKANSHQFSKIQMDELYASIKHAELERPPYDDEPDLSWRGIVTWRYDGVNHKPKVRVGGSFVKQLQEDSKRAEFELTRAMVMSWNPCQMKKKGYADIWVGLLECLGFSGNPTCEAGTFSMENWVMATAIAGEVSPPGCLIPAFETVETNKCLDRVTKQSSERKTASK